MSFATLRACALLLCAATVVAGAGPQHGGSSAPAFSLADVEFFQSMIPHQAQALDIADLADTRSQDDKVRAFARQLSQSRTEAIRTMQEWLTARGQFAPERFAHHGDIPDLPGLVSREAMHRLADARGAAFDRQFVVLLTAHHEGALAMIAALRRESGAAREDDASAMLSAMERAYRSDLEQLRHLSGVSAR